MKHIAVPDCMLLLDQLSQRNVLHWYGLLLLCLCVDSLLE